ncbi:MAG: phosphatase PAP2 family protein [Bacteroidota bacterium]
MNKLFSAIAVVVLLYSFQLSFAQITSIHPIEKVKTHYADLQQIEASPQGKMAWMDTLAHPPELYKSVALLFAMAKPHYLTSDQVDYLVKSVKYPANSSKQTRAELDFLLDLQEKRTDAEVDRVMTLAKVGYWPDANFGEKHPRYQQNLEYLFYECAEVVGENCSAANYPKTSKLLQGIMNDMRIMEFAVKYHLLRARPYQLEPKLKPTTIMGSPSFASGHTLWAYIQAYTWSELMPEKRQQYLDLAYEIGLSREIMGVHYPSDEEAARQLAHRMLFLMWHTDSFQQDFLAAKKEWE